MCSCEEGEYPDISRRVVRIARREHRCSGCQRPIRVGRRYLQLDWLFEGAWDHRKVCLVCERLRLAWHKVENCWTSADEVRECIREEVRLVGTVRKVFVASRGQRVVA